MNTRRKLGLNLRQTSSLDDNVSHFLKNKDEYEIFLQDNYIRKYLCSHKG